MIEYKVQYESVGKILGGRPQENVSEGYIKDLIEGTLGEKFKALTDEEKVKEMKAWRAKSITVFRRMPNGQLALGAVQLKSAMKEVDRVFGFKLKQQLQHAVWVKGVTVDGEEYLPLFRDGKPIMKAECYEENFIPPTYGNPKACIKVWEALRAGITFAAIIEIKTSHLTPEVVVSTSTTKPKRPKLNIIDALGELTRGVDAIGSGRGQQHGRVKRVGLDKVED